MVVENPGLKEFFFEESLEETWVGIFPHQNRVVLGGVAFESDDLAADRVETDRILRRCSAVEPRLAGCKVLDVEVGLRPGRPEVRLDREELNGSLCIHNYGHSNVGVALSWGCAIDVVGLVEGS